MEQLGQSVVRASLTMEAVPWGTRLNLTCTYTDSAIQVKGVALPDPHGAYEAGLKSTLLDGRMRANATVFYNDYQDFQARVGRAIVSPS